MKQLLLSLAALAMCAVAVGSFVPPIPANLLPPAIHPTAPIPISERPEPIPDPQGPMTPSRLNRIPPVSTPIYSALLQESLRHSTALLVDGDFPLGTTPDNSPLLRAVPIHVRLAPDAYAGTTVKASNDTSQDVEPTVVALNISGTVHTTTVAIKYTRDADGVFRTHLWAYHTTNFSSFSTPQELQVPNDPQTGLPQYTWAGGPLAECKFLHRRDGTTTVVLYRPDV